MPPKTIIMIYSAAGHVEAEKILDKLNRGYGNVIDNNITWDDIKNYDIKHHEMHIQTKDDEKYIVDLDDICEVSISYKWPVEVEEIDNKGKRINLLDSKYERNQ